MRMRTLALGLLATLGWVGASMAATPPPSHTTHKSSSHTLTGTIDSYDATAHTLNVKTTKGAESFAATDAKVWAGTKSVTLDQLASDIGAKVKVTYLEKEGHKTATAIHVTPPSPKSTH